MYQVVFASPSARLQVEMSRLSRRDDALGVHVPNWTLVVMADPQKSCLSKL